MILIEDVTLAYIYKGILISIYTIAIGYVFFN